MSANKLTYLLHLRVFLSFLQIIRGFDYPGKYIFPNQPGWSGVYCISNNGRDRTRDLSHSSGWRTSLAFIHTHISKWMLHIFEDVRPTQFVMYTYLISWAVFDEQSCQSLWYRAILHPLGIQRFFFVHVLNSLFSHIREFSVLLDLTVWSGQDFTVSYR
jgi:hypothetical protein